jgi:hypothetical protein
MGRYLSTVRLFALALQITLAFERPGGVLRMRRRCLNGVVRGIIGIGAAVEVAMDPSAAGGWHKQSKGDGMSVGQTGERTGVQSVLKKATIEIPI